MHRSACRTNRRIPPRRALRLLQPLVHATARHDFSSALHAALFSFFEPLRNQRGKRGLQFQKRYDDICNEWLGGLSSVTRFRTFSAISSVRIWINSSRAIPVVLFDREGETREGFVITFRPGDSFFADYEKFYRHRNQGELQWKFHADQRDIAEPLKVAYLFIEKRNGRSGGGVPYVSPGGSARQRHPLASCLRRCYRVSRLRPWAGAAGPIMPLRASLAS